MHSDVAGQKILGSTEAELRIDPAEASEGGPVIDPGAEILQSTTMHEHHAVHELNAGFLASRQNLFNLGYVDATGFLAENVFSGFRRFDDPLLANASGKGNVNRIDIVPGKQLLVAFHRFGTMREGNMTRTFINPSVSLRLIPAGDCDNLAVAAQGDGLPVFDANPCGTQEPPTTLLLTHNACFNPSSESF